MVWVKNILSPVQTFSLCLSMNWMFISKVNFYGKVLHLGVGGHPVLLPNQGQNSSESHLAFYIYIFNFLLQNTQI